jgi:hypothetical protein
MDNKTTKRHLDKVAGSKVIDIGITAIFSIRIDHNQPMTTTTNISTRNTSTNTVSVGLVLEIVHLTRSHG